MIANRKYTLTLLSLSVLLLSVPTASYIFVDGFQYQQYQHQQYQRYQPPAKSLPTPVLFASSSSSSSLLLRRRKRGGGVRVVSRLQGTSHPTSATRTKDAVTTTNGQDTVEDTIVPTTRLLYEQDQQQQQDGVCTIGLITVLFATNSPVLHGAFSTGPVAPPVLLVNAAVSVVAFVGIRLSSSFSSSLGDRSDRDGNTSKNDDRDDDAFNKDQRQQLLLVPQQITNDDTNEQNPTQQQQRLIVRGGMELGVWKFFGTTANLFGLAATSATHGAVLIQVTTVLVPLLRRVVYHDVIPTKVQLSIVGAVVGVACFATETTMTGGGGGSTPTLHGDLCCLVAAICYSAYDLRLYEYGQQIEPEPLIRTKIATQTLLSCLLYLLYTAAVVATTATAESATIVNEGAVAVTAAGGGEGTATLFSVLSDTIFADGTVLVSSPIVIGAIIWSGIAVNAVAPFLQVQGQQIVGPTKCQTIYASQPLWAAILSYIVLGETLGYRGIIGGCIFITALILAAGTEIPATTTSSTTTTPSAINVVKGIE